MNLSALAAATAGSILVFALVASSAAPALRTPPPTSPAPLSGALWGGLESLSAQPSNATLLVSGANRAYQDAEVAAARQFLERGGRILVADPTPEAAALVRALDVGIEVRPWRVFDPDVDAAGTMALSPTGALGVSGDVRVRVAQVVDGDGDPILSTTDFTWEDRNADGVPEIGEPRGQWDVAQVRTVGAGAIVVLGSGELLNHPVVGPHLADWMRADHAVVLLDGEHRAGEDPAGMTNLLAGHAPGPLASLVATVALVSGGLAWRLRARRVRPRRRRARARDVETLETLAELEV